jgi:hypothetical protein
MSTVSLPSYLARPPSYALGRQGQGHRFTLVDRLGPQLSGAFVKHSRGGDVFLRLNAQEDDASPPVYGSGALVEGTVELTKSEGVNSVEVKVSNCCGLHTGILK